MRGSFVPFIRGEVVNSYPFVEKIIYLDRSHLLLLIYITLRGITQCVLCGKGNKAGIFHITTCVFAKFCFHITSYISNYIAYGYALLVVYDLGYIYI